MKRIVVFLPFVGMVFAQPKIQGTAIFPASNIWNVRVDSLPVDSNSIPIIATVRAAYAAKYKLPFPHLKLDDVIPINVVHASQPLVPVAGPSPANQNGDPGGFPIPSNVLTEGPGDRHALIVDVDSGIEYDIYALQGSPGKWTAGSTAKWDLASNALRPDGWTSADAAGLPMVPGIVRFQEIREGAVLHALRLSALQTAYQAYRWPARHYASHDNNPNDPQMGMRLRLKASFDISRFSRINQILLTALKRYGMIISDNGMPWSMEHDQDPAWDAKDLLALHDVPDSALEVVDTSGLMSDPNQGTAIQPPPAGVYANDKLGRPSVITFSELAARLDSARRARQ
jgi:hypothetical protein